MKLRKWLALAVCLALVFSLCACRGGSGGGDDPAPTDTPSSSPDVTPTASSEVTPDPTQEPDTRQSVRVAMLKGPTGLGAVKLMADNDAGTTALRYEFSVDTDASLIPGKLTGGEVDIAALPTNVAANLYNKTEDIRLLALNTLGVLHILENGNEIQSIEDLAGRTLYAAGQGANPQYVLDYLLDGADITDEVEIIWKSADEISALMAAGEIDLAMLPVPAATAVLLKNPDVRDALDLTEVWEAASFEFGVLTMGCVVVRTQFAAAHPEAVAVFLEEYAASIEYVRSEPQLSGALAEHYGITPSAAVGEAAIPGANLVCITGTDAARSIQGYYAVLYSADPSSIGGGIPDDAFFYVP